MLTLMFGTITIILSPHILNKKTRIQPNTILKTKLTFLQFNVQRKIFQITASNESDGFPVIEKALMMWSSEKHNELREKMMFFCPDFMFYESKVNMNFFIIIRFNYSFYLNKFSSICSRFK